MIVPAPAVRRYVAWLSRNAARVRAGSLVVAVVAAAALLRLEFDVGLVSMLPRGSARFADYQRFVERFGAQDLAIVLVHGRDRETTRRFADALARELEARPEIEILGEAGDAQTAFNAETELLDRFSLDPFQTKADTLLALAESPEAPTLVKAVAEGYLALTENGLEPGQAPLARKLAGRALKAARQTDDVDSINQVVLRYKELEEVAEPTVPNP